MAGAFDDAILHPPGVFVGIDIDPAGEILAVEQVTEFQIVNDPGGSCMGSGS